MLYKDELFRIGTAAYAVWNTVVFTLYGTDKLKSKRGKRRISEKSLLICAFLFGGIGAWAGMEVFRHKTKHARFRILVPLFAVLNAVLLCVCVKILA